MKALLTTGALALLLTGCAAGTVSTNAQKASISSCAAAGEYAQGIALADPAAKAKANAMLEVLAPVCTSATPDQSLTTAQQTAFSWLFTKFEGLKNG